jgi:uncharacterized protein YjgD (DUF1641 family)
MRLTIEELAEIIDETLSETVIEVAEILEIAIKVTQLLQGDTLIDLSPDEHVRKGRGIEEDRFVSQILNTVRTKIEQSV